MNRRSFTASLAALFAVPALPAVASLAPAAATQTAVSHYATAKLLARAHNRCSPEMLQRLLRVDSVMAQELNAMLLKRGVISGAGAHGVSMAVEPLNTHCITNEAMRSSNLVQKVRKAKVRIDKLDKVSEAFETPQHANASNTDQQSGSESG
jgi:hypothetical protein